MRGVWTGAIALSQPIQMKSRNWHGFTYNIDKLYFLWTKVFNVLPGTPDVASAAPVPLSHGRIG